MKISKYFSSAVSVAAAFGVFGTTVSALYDPDKNGKTDEKDFKHLTDTLHGINSTSAEDDVNGDGKLNILDMIELKNALIEKEETGEVISRTFRAVDENVKLTGRTYDDSDVTWLVHSGSAAEFDLTASEATVVLAGDSAIKAEERYRPRYAVYVDDKLIEDSLMDTPEKEIVLLKEKSQKTVRVKIIHLSEANNGAIGVKTIKTMSSSKSPIVPVPAKKLSIEFIGDSITCAYGVEGKSSSDPFMTSTENFMKSYAYLTAQKLDADYSAVSYSGHGIISGYSSGNEKETGSLVPDYYTDVAKLSDYAKPWDFKNHHNDVIVVNLGTNDDTYVRNDPETRLPEFEKGYIDFLKVIRENNPDAYIICTVGTMGCEEIYPAIENAVMKFRESVDEKIMCYLSAVQNPANGYGADWHPSAVTQQMSAYVLADKICGVLGMESDKIGLDAAEDGKYGIQINEEAGAGASDYLGYDKSYWVNMVCGGKEKSDVRAYISGIPLTAGTYRLKFEIVAGKDTDIPVSVMNDGGSEEKYFERTVSAGTEKVQFEETFVMKKADDKCMLTFDVGGMDYYNITLSNVSLVKISS